MIKVEKTNDGGIKTKMEGDALTLLQEWGWAAVEMMVAFISHGADKEEAFNDIDQAVKAAKITVKKKLAAEGKEEVDTEEELDDALRAIVRRILKGLEND